MHTPRVLRDRATRRVATVLFVDVVDSTRVAAEVGDARWRELVATFRGTVRRQLKRHGGHEVDTAGDGFFATFDNPASALRAAAGIVRAVQALGLDVRCGLHTGELERIDGRLGGIGAHIGARVMARAEAAQVLTTGTVRDLVVGGAMTFDSIGEFELKGVPGMWAVHRLTSVDGDPLPTAQSAEEAASRRATPKANAGRWRVAALIGAASFTVVAAIAILQVTRDEAAGETPSASASASPPAPVALMKLDPITRELVAVRDPALPPFGGDVQIADGNLWYRMGDTLTRRDLESGEVLLRIELPPETHRWQQAFGTMWIGHGITQYPPMIGRFNPSSGRPGEPIDPQVGIYDFAVGDDAIYLLTTESEVIELDPVSGEERVRHPTRTETLTPYIGFIDGLLMLFESGAHRLTLLDPDTDTIVNTLEAPQLGWGAGAVDPVTGTFWVTDRRRSTITPFNLETGEADAPIGLNGVPRGLAFGMDGLWLAAEGWVYRINSHSHEVTATQMPEGVTATGVAIDEETGTIWISTCAVDCDDPI